MAQGRDALIPQLVAYDHGKHNADLELARGRVLEGGSWKHQRTVVLIPSARTIPAKVALSHWNLIFPPNQPVYRMLCLGMEVGDAYSRAVETVLAHPELSKWEYILTVEHDNVPPPDGFLRLVRQMELHPEYACIGGLYWTKGPGGVPQIWGDPKDPVLNWRPQPPKPGELVECCGTGMGFNVFRVSMFKDPKLPKPLFQTNPMGATQDLAFWANARPLGYRAAIDCDVLVGHHSLEEDFTW